MTIRHRNQVGFPEMNDAFDLFRLEIMDGNNFVNIHRNGKGEYVVTGVSRDCMMQLATLKKDRDAGNTGSMMGEKAVMFKPVLAVDNVGGEGEV